MYNQGGSCVKGASSEIKLRKGRCTAGALWVLQGLRRHSSTLSQTKRRGNTGLDILSPVLRWRNVLLCYLFSFNYSFFRTFQSG